MTSRLTRYIQKNHRTQKAFGQKIGITEVPMSNISTGVRKPFRHEEEKLLAALGLRKYRYLIGEPRYVPDDELEKMENDRKVANY